MTPSFSHLHQHGGQSNDLLAKLPDGILVQIFEAVAHASKRDLCHVSRLSHRYHVLADAVLYKTVHFLTPELHLIFSKSLRRRPRRGSAIHEVKIAYPASSLSTLITDVPNCSATNGHHGALPIDQLSRTLSTMSNLETLDLAVPDSLLHGVGQLFNGPFDLACLQSCTLFYQCDDDQYWDLQENIHIFAQPTLKTLVIKRAKLDYRGFDLIERPEQTGLTRLHLIECDINDDALSDLLAFPEALKEFVMTQAPEPSPELEESSGSIRDYMIALQSAAHSLETITVDFPLLQSARALQLREFVQLKTLRLNWDHQLFGKTSKKPRMTSVGLPPELETLEFFNELGTDEEVTDLLVSALETINFSARKFTRMIVIEGEDGNTVPKAVEEACKAQEQLQLDIIGRMDTVNDSIFQDVEY